MISVSHMKALVMLLFAAALAGCARKSEPTAESGEPAELATVSTEIDTSMRTNRLTEREFFESIYVPAYDAVGKKNPKWDAAARTFLGQLSESVVSKTNNAILEQEIAEALKNVQATGCEDPLVRYMILRQTQDPHHAGREGTNAWVQAALDLDASDYPEYWKCFSYMRAAQALKSIPAESNTVEVITFRQAASDRLIQLVKDYRLPASVMYSAVYPWLVKDLARAHMKKYVYESIEHNLREGWGDTAEMHLIRGGFYLQYAWDARGGGWASTVSDESWDMMKKRLTIARESLERSWLIHPLLETALQMQWVELGDSRGRQAMERWFQNAIELDPASYTAYENKLEWLMPRWYGSTEEVVAFGRECLTNTNGSIPLILHDVHRLLAIYQEHIKQGTAAAYLKRPEVWADVKLSFETFFRFHPEEIGWRHNYALAAYKAEAWDDLRKQIKLLGPINYRYFGEKGAFDEMVRKAEELGRELVLP